MVLFYLTTGGEFPYFTEIEDWHQHQQTINYDDLWNFSNSFFEFGEEFNSILEGIQDVINQMIVVERSMRISVELARRKIPRFKYQRVLVLSSTGLSGECWGNSNRLGVFEYLQQYNNSPAYRQRHSVAGTQPHHLYRDDEGNWAVGWKLGGPSSGLLNRTSTDSVPTNNWLYRDSGLGGWKSDSELSVSNSHPSVCGVISIYLHALAETAQRLAGGEYRATGDWSAGRPVFSNGLTYLCVEPGGTKWCVSYSHYIDNKQ